MLENTAKVPYRLGLSSLGCRCTYTQGLLHILTKLSQRATQPMTLLPTVCFLVQVVFSNEQVLATMQFRLVAKVVPALFKQ